MADPDGFSDPVLVADISGYVRLANQPARDCLAVPGDGELEGRTLPDLLRCIRGDSESAHTPLIILSAMIEEDDQMTGLLSGVDEYLAKPFKPSVLCATLERVMQITPEERERRLLQLAAEEPRL